MEQAEIERIVDDLDTDLDRLRALYDQYFMGLQKIEPMVLRKEIDRRLYAVRREQIRNTGVRFRFNMISQRYNTFQTYWGRICRQIEEGTYKRHMLRAKERFGTIKPLQPPSAKPQLDNFGVIEPDFGPDSERPAPDWEFDVDVDADDMFQGVFDLPAAPPLPAITLPPGRPDPTIDAPTERRMEIAQRFEPDPTSYSREFVIPPPPPTSRAAEVRTQIASPSLRWPSLEPPPPSSSGSRPAVPSAPGSLPRPPISVARPQPGAPSIAPPRFSMSAPPLVSKAPHPSGLSDDRVRQLYSQYVDTKRKQNESTAAITFDGLAKSLRESSTKLREKHGKGIDFEVVTKDGKTIIRPVIK